MSEAPAVGRDAETGALAAQIAGGSGLVFAGGIVDRGLRWALKWALAGLVGPGPLGLIELATRVSATITAFSPLGLDTGVVYFVARLRAAGDQSGIKGLVIAALGVSVVVGAVSGLTLSALAWSGSFGAEPPGLVAALVAAGPLVALSTPLLTLVGLLRAVKDMRRSTLAFQVVLPLGLLLLTVPTVELGGGAVGAVVCMSAATVVALGVAGRAVFSLWGPLMRDAALVPRFSLGPLLAFSIPQSLTAAAFRLNQYFDVLILGYFADAPTVGVYAVASSVAGFGSVPSNAVISMFNPFVAELVASGDRARLDRLLKAVSRWLVLISLPVFLALMLLPDLVLLVYPEAFAGAAPVLAVLALGQVVQTAAAPAMRLIPMSGHAGLNLINGVAALVLNLALSWWLVPTYGGMGAAWAGAITLSSWSAWRLIEVWWMLRCFPFDGRTLLVMAVAAAGAGAIRLGLPADSLALRAGALLGVFALIGVLVAVQGKTNEDAALIERVQRRFGRLRR